MDIGFSLRLQSWSPEEVVARNSTNIELGIDLWCAIPSNSQLHAEFFSIRVSPQAHILTFTFRSLLILLLHLGTGNANDIASCCAISIASPIKIIKVISTALLTQKHTSEKSNIIMKISMPFLCSPIEDITMELLLLI